MDDAEERGHTPEIFPCTLWDRPGIVKCFFKQIQIDADQMPKNGTRPDLGERPYIYRDANFFTFAPARAGFSGAA